MFKAIGGFVLWVEVLTCALEHYAQVIGVDNNPSAIADARQMPSIMG